jgi:hypothetical protein
MGIYSSKLNHNVLGMVEGMQRTALKQERKTLVAISPSLVLANFIDKNKKLSTDLIAKVISIGSMIFEAYVRIKYAIVICLCIDLYQSIKNKKFNDRASIENLQVIYNIGKKLLELNK